MKYMLAMECSKPAATKVMMGKKIAQTFPMMSVAAMDIQTARTTIQLQSTPRKNPWTTGRDILPAATWSALPPTALSARPEK